MNTHQGRWKIALGCALLMTAAGASFSQEGPANPSEVYGPRVQASSSQVVGFQVERRSNLPADGFRFWNEIAVNASGLDHTPVAAGENRIFGEQLGPGRSARAMAIVHIAMFDAVNAILGGYRSYTGLARTSQDTSIDAAIATAAHDTLIKMFPSQKAAFDTFYAEDLRRIQVSSTRKARGVTLGRRAAQLILARRANDGSAGADPLIGTEWPLSDAAGHWRQDPIGLAPIAMGAKWGLVKPFVLRSAAQFRVPAPPALSSAAYTQAFNEVKALGGDGEQTPTRRTAEQTLIGLYWAYDGTPSLCAPPRLYNQVAAEISKSNNNVIELVRLFALVHVSMADAGIASWESKYFHDVWRPVTGIRESDAGTGPSGTGDGNPATVGDPTFAPLGAPASNLIGTDFTPPFPAYPSGHATFGGALFETLRNVYRTDRIAFTFTSDELNGVTTDSNGVVRPLVPRSFTSLSQAEEENGQSRIYLGIHWAFDKTEGIRQGRRVADHVFANAFQRVR